MLPLLINGNCDTCMYTLVFRGWAVIVAIYSMRVYGAAIQHVCVCVRGSYTACVCTGQLYSMCVYGAAIQHACVRGSYTACVCVRGSYTACVHVRGVYTVHLV